MEITPQTLASGVYALVGIAAILVAMGQVKKSLSEQFMTKDACTECRGKCSNSVNTKLETMNKTLVELSVVQKLIAKNMKITMENDDENIR